MGATDAKEVTSKRCVRGAKKTCILEGGGRTLRKSREVMGARKAYTDNGT